MSREVRIKAAAVQFHADVTEGFTGVEFTESDLAWLLHCAAKFARSCAPNGGIAAATLDRYDYLNFVTAPKTHFEVSA